MQLEHTISKAFEQFGISGPGSSGHWEKFIELGQVKAYKKGSIIKESHQTEKYLHILISGVATSSVWDDSRLPKCIDLYFENDFFLDYHSFINQIPTPVENKVLSDAKLFSVPHKSFIKLLEASPFGDKITRIITDYHFAGKQKQQIDLLTKSSTERLNDLKHLHPDVLTRIPKKVVASYLGITPQSLSRIIKKA